MFSSLTPAAATSATKEPLTLTFSASPLHGLLPSPYAHASPPHKAPSFSGLVLPATGSAKLNMWSLSFTHHFTSSHPALAIEGLHSFLILDAVAPCQFSVLLATWQHLLHHDPFLLIAWKSFLAEPQVPTQNSACSTILSHFLLLTYFLLSLWTSFPHSRDVKMLL